jgi:hypothetical protein
MVAWILVTRKFPLVAKFPLDVWELAFGEQIQFYEMGFTYCHMLLPRIVASEFSFGFSH